MTKERKKPNLEVLTSEVNSSELSPNLPSQNLKLLEIDKMALDLAKERRLTALAEAKTAIAKSENAELSFKYVVLQLYMKYGLTSNDAISEEGAIIKNGALQQGQS